jgi:hypothetical protein
LCCFGEDLLHLADVNNPASIQFELFHMIFSALPRKGCWHLTIHNTMHITISR